MIDMRALVYKYVMINVCLYVCTLIYVHGQDGQELLGVDKSAFVFFWWKLVQDRVLP